MQVMKEIGGYLELEDFKGAEYYPDAVPVNNARNGLLYLIKARNIHKLYIPYYLCDSVSGLCEREGCSYDLYPIHEDFTPAFEGSVREGEYLYVVNYFGRLDDARILEFKSKYGNIILDNVQAFFQRPLPSVDTIYSCRKFFGVPDGGYVATEARLLEEIPVDVSMDRMRHVLGRYDGMSASDFYNDFKANDHSFKSLALHLMSRLTHNLLKAVDYVKAKERREENYTFLAEHLREMNRLPDVCPVGPYMYPFYCRNGMEVKKRLATRKIYVPTLWPNVLSCGRALERDYAENILPLPCDQRYGLDDMKRLTEEIRKEVLCR